MTTRRVLIFAPLILTLFLLQSYFWVPTYEQQARGNPERFDEYITGSIGDAAILNPILSADSASSEIESKVFEGLIDRDENLQFRGRLARSWQISEDAYFYVNASAAIPGGASSDAQNIVALLEEARKNDSITDEKLKKSLANIKNISLIGPRDLSTTRQINDPGDNRKKIEVKIEAAAPARIKLHLQEVDQDLFNNLTGLLGQNYFHSFSPEAFLTTDPKLPQDKLRVMAGEILPAVEHNPVIEFHLRPNVAFHDGHIFDAQDVKFTYEAILNPKNLSPRIADYEPVKSVTVVDPLTVRIVYKRLYSPAIGTWAMGILPQHLLNEAALEKEAAARGLDPATFSMRQSLFNRRPIGFIPDLLTQEMEFYAGTLDSYSVQPYQVDRLKNDPRFQSFSGTSFGYSYIGYNMRREPFNDVRVRRALGMAIDVDKIIRYLLDNQAERITGPFVKQTDYYNHAVKPLPYDPQGALKLLAEAGWRPNQQGWLEKNGRPLQFTLITNSGNDIRKAILAIAQDAWKKIGINVQTDLLEWSVFIQERVNKLDFDALVLGWSMGIEPDLYQIWHSSQTGPQQLNFVGFKNHEADALIVKIRQDYDHRSQVEYCHQLHALIAREQPYTFLYVGKWTAILDKRIVIKEVDAAGKVVYKKITPTKTGNFQYYFNQWIKLPKMPELES
ncbi:MAG: ABC transporter substrate-binding protein [Desulfobacterales bacterium]